MALERIVDERLFRFTPWTFFATALDLYFGEQFLACATATYVALGDSHYLVTNAHNLTGRSPDTGQLVSAQGAVPDTVVAWLMGFEQPTPESIEYSLDHWRPKRLSLYDEEGSARWLVHPRFRDVDVVCLPMETKGGLFPAIRLDNYVEPTDVRDGSPLTVIGFPRGKPSEAKLPQSIDGMLVTNWIPGIEVRPRFLIDAPTFSGSSGSPVLGPTGHTALVELFGRRTYLPEMRALGIYSGRLLRSPHEVKPPSFAHGQVWKLRTVAEILAGGQRSTARI